MQGERDGENGPAVRGIDGEFTREHPALLPTGTLPAALREGSASVAERHFAEAVKKVRPTMNERSREYYRRMREVFKGGLPKEVQPPEYQ